MKKGSFSFSKMFSMKIDAKSEEIFEKDEINAELFSRPAE